MREDPVPIFGGSAALRERIEDLELMDMVVAESVFTPEPEWLIAGEVDDIGPCARFEAMARIRDARIGLRRIKSYARVSRSGRSKIETHNERARIKGGSYCLTSSEWQNILLAFKSSCAYCGEWVRFPVLEHLVPVHHGGGTDAHNVVPACANCNTKKGRKMPWEWIPSERYEEIKAMLRKANP
jgi:hypothetical protein